MKKVTKLLFFLVFLHQASYSQSPGNVKGCGVWVKNESTLENFISKENKKDKKEKTSFFNDLNFNSAIDFSKSDRVIIEKGILKNRFTLFVVYKSNEEKEKSLLSGKIDNDNLNITTKKVINSNKIDYQKKNPENGVVVSYFSSAENTGKSNLKFMSFGVEQDSTSLKKKTSLLEFIYYPRILNAIERQKIDSYLSIKYGISLDGEKDYLNHKNDKIWDFKINKEFNNRVTGIGRNDLMGLNQKESGNSTKDGIYIGFGEKMDSLVILNKTVVNNNTSLIWGDNGKTTILKKDKENPDSVSKMERIWRLQKTSEKDSLKTLLLLNKEQLKFEPKSEKSTQKKSEENKIKESLWLVVDKSQGTAFDYFNSEYLKETSATDKEVLFKNIYWSNQKNATVAFTIVKAPDLFFDYQLESPDCSNTDKGKINLKIHGGTAPYTVITEKNGAAYSTSRYDSKQMSVENIVVGNDYTIVVKDKNNQVCSKSLSIESFEAIKCQLASQWYLDSNNKVLIKPITSSTEPITFEWSKDNKVLSNEAEFNASEIGDYILKATNGKGCSKEMKFNIGNANEKEGWVLYPNPTKAGDNFSISFNLKNQVEASISIYDMNGRKIKYNNLGTISEYLHKDSLSISGTYMILLSTGDKTESIKLIVE